MTECVECGAEVSLHDDLEVGEIVDRTTCGAELEVVDTEPPVLERAPELKRTGVSDLADGRDFAVPCAAGSQSA